MLVCLSSLILLKILLIDFSSNHYKVSKENSFSVMGEKGYKPCLLERMDGRIVHFTLRPRCRTVTKTKTEVLRVGMYEH